MINLKNCGTKAFREYVQNKTIYLFGAGRALASVLDIYFEKMDVELVVDNDPKKHGNIIRHNEHDVRIVGIDEFVNLIRRNESEEKLLMITSPFYVSEIVHQLDDIPELDGLDCFLQILIRNTKEIIPSYSFTHGEPRIPKKIHFIWIGGKPLPYEFERNIDSWRVFNPDYEIVKWDENNYDFMKSEYMKQAYEKREWGFVSNYARLDIIYREGGIYLDTDVEAMKGFDCLLNDNAFFNMGCADRINMGCGFGACANEPIIQEMRDMFEHSSFNDSYGKAMKKQFHTYIHPVMKKYGFKLVNEYQKRSGVVLYPTEVMSPWTIEGMENFTSEKTISIHKEAGSWKTKTECKNDEYEELIKRVSNI